ncbi:CPXCG motif-containing cysteine-rich protein [Rubripirellula amarantea]|nr:CPXCG motif-containing cysteine-rich protein [Rubripirellula amarantea]MDA8745732.1 CPXCG motif-containing cysteine-rich protein [Rubripirellula amarantea]
MTIHDAIDTDGFEFGHQYRVYKMQDEATYICDSCGEEIVIPLDPVAGRSQSYVEDCPVCCNPSVIHVEWDEDEPRVWAEAEQDLN